MLPASVCPVVKWGNYFLGTATLQVIISESWRKRQDYEGVTTAKGEFCKTEVKKKKAILDGCCRGRGRGAGRAGWELGERL